MHPDLPPHGHSGDDPLDQWLHTLPVPRLPEHWRSGILAAAIPPPQPPFFSKSFVSFLGLGWGLIGILHLTTPTEPPLPSGSLPHRFPPPSYHESRDLSDPWLAQLPQPSYFPQP